MTESEIEEEKKETAKIMRLINKIGTVLEESDISISASSCIILGLLAITSRMLPSEDGRKRYLKRCIKSIEDLIEGGQEDD